MCNGKKRGSTVVLLVPVDRIILQHLNIIPHPSCEDSGLSQLLRLAQIELDMCFSNYSAYAIRVLCEDTGIVFYCPKEQIVCQATNSVSLAK